MYDVLIVGCGVVGAATAYELSKYDLKVAILERFNDIANGATKANSAILHAGYDPMPGTKMAALNYRGIRLAKEICERLDVSRRELPSFVIAFNDTDMEEVRRLYDRGIQNGVNVKIMSRSEVLAIDNSINPEIVGALYSPDAAIVNPWEYAIAMAEVAVLNGTELHLETEVCGIDKLDDGTLNVKTNNGCFNTHYVVNAAGCFCGDIASMVGDTRIHQNNVSGQYFVLDKVEGKNVNSVIFRCPDEKGKGVLVSPTVHGNLIVGPDASPVGHGDNVANTAAELAYVRETGAKSVPGINYRNMIHEYAGVRPSTQFKDFVIDISPTCGSFINLAGICSPGLSAAPAIAEEGVKLLAQAGLMLNKRSEFLNERPPVVRFAELSAEEKRKKIAENPLYGQIICRCETITEGEIVDALHRPIVPKTIDAIKRRVRAGMGRCQGGFCSPRVHEIIARELGMRMEDVLLDEQGTYILTGKTKTFGGDN